VKASGTVNHYKFVMWFVICTAERASLPATDEAGIVHPAAVAVPAVICAVVVTAVVAACLWRYVVRKQKRKTELEMKSMKQRLL